MSAAYFCAHLAKLLAVAPAPAPPPAPSGGTVYGFEDLLTQNAGVFEDAHPGSAYPGLTFNAQARVTMAQVAYGQSSVFGVQRQLLLYGDSTRTASYELGSAALYSLDGELTITWVTGTDKISFFYNCANDLEIEVLVGSTWVNVDVLPPTPLIPATQSRNNWNEARVEIFSLATGIRFPNQSPGTCAIDALTIGGLAPLSATPYVPAGGSTLSSAWLSSFRTDPHDQPLGTMPTWLFDWSTTGRVNSTNYIGVNASTHKNLVPWNTIFAAGASTIWPTDVGVEIGTHELWGKRISTGAWELIRSWPTINAWKHNRDDYGYNGGSWVSEDFGTDSTAANTRKTTSAGTWVVRRSNNATFPSQGTHIHSFFHDDAGGSRMFCDRTLYTMLAVRGRYRAVTWPASDGLAPGVNPASNASGDKLVALLAADCYNGNGDFSTTYGGDIGIARAVYIKNDWRWLHWYTAPASVIEADPPTYIE